MIGRLSLRKTFDETALGSSRRRPLFVSTDVDDVIDDTVPTVLPFVRKGINAKALPPRMPEKPSRKTIVISSRCNPLLLPLLQLLMVLRR